ncbi:MAG: hypothetical protein ABI439_00335 [Rhodospirillales bacterium]
MLDLRIAGMAGRGDGDVLVNAVGDDGYLLAVNRAVGQLQAEQAAGYSSNGTAFSLPNLLSLKLAGALPYISASNRSARATALRAGRCRW